MTVFSNDNESVDFLTLKHEILEQSFQFLSKGVVNGNYSNEKNCIIMKIFSMMTCIHIQCTAL